MLSVTAARLLVRQFKKDLQFGLDDWLILPALIISLSWPILNIMTVRVGGGGKHLYDVTYHELAMSNWTGTFAKLNFYVAQGFIKLSITSFNMRLTGLSSRKWMYAHWAFFGVIAAFTTTAVFLVTFQCVPVAAGFDSIATGKLETAPKCLTEAQVNHPLTIWNTVMDFMLLFVPVIVLWKVQIPWSTKIRLFLLFSVGAVCCFAAVMRQVSQQRLNTDFTYNYTALVYWSLADLGMSLIVASLPVLSSVILGCGLATRKSNRPSGYSSSLSRFKAAGSHASGPNPDLASKNSQEGIMRQDEVELQYHNRDPTGVEDIEMNRNNILGFAR
ncbi:MAG: hypothetical protein Q9183_006690 [Haloplaca sp. 2 TL-2023]